MASSTLIFSRWILPFLFSFALSLFFSSSPRFLSNRNRRYRDDEKSRANEKSSQPLRSPDDRFEHNVDRDTRLWSQRQCMVFYDDLEAVPVTCCRVARRTLEWAERGRTVSETRKDPIPGKLHACAQSSRGHEGGRRSWLSPSLGAPFLRTWTRSSLSQGWSFDFSLTGWVLPCDFRIKKLFTVFFLISIV